MTNAAELPTLKQTASLLAAPERTQTRWHFFRRGSARITKTRAADDWLRLNKTEPNETFEGDNYGNA